MKKLLFLLFVLFLFSCEIYVEPSNSQLNINGEWKIVNISATYSEDLIIVNDNFYAISPFTVILTSDNKWLLQNDTTNIRACYFFKEGYQWEFDYNQLIIRTDKGNLIGWYYVGFMNEYYNSNYFMLDDKATGASVAGVWEFLPENGSGSFPANILYITVPEIEFNIDGPERSFDRLISQNITLTLMK
jgi:hypothetical protein